MKKCLEEQGLKFVGQDVGGERMEIVELEGERGGHVGGGSAGTGHRGVSTQLVAGR